MNPIDLTVIAVYIAGCTALGAWLGSRSQGLKGYFLAESNIPAWAVMISIVATETSTATFLSVPGVAYSGDFTFLQLAFGYILGRVVVATVLLPAYFRGKIFTAYQLLQDRFGGPTRTTASILFLIARSLGDGLRLFLAATVLQHLTGWSTESSHCDRGGDHRGLYVPRWDEGCDLDRRHPVQRLHRRRCCGPDDPRGQASWRLVRTGPDGRCRRQVSAFRLLARR